MERTIIGVDCSARLTNVGLAVAREHPGGWHLERAFVCGPSRRPVTCVRQWINAAPGQVLLALDAPLGWPQTLGPALTGHRAGGPLPGSADDLFRRYTDNRVHEVVQKRGFDVGAGWIARTAHAALQLLSELRTSTKLDISLAWEPGFSGVRAIEVYPTATLLAHGVDTRGYKKHLAPREPIIAKLKEHLALGQCEEVIRGAVDALDAAVCVLAGVDFLGGDALAPDDVERSEKEGWIWMRKPKIL